MYICTRHDELYLVIPYNTLHITYTISNVTFVRNKGVWSESKKYVSTLLFILLIFPRVENKWFCF